MNRVKYCTPTARTNGSANRSWVRPLWRATALVAAPNVAVIPTPVVGPHVSLSVRTIWPLPVRLASYHQVNAHSPTKQQHRGDGRGHHHETRRHPRRTGLAQQYADNHSAQPHDQPGRHHGGGP